ncbi:hypothetical protein [Tabrizicola aquatica]|uniref:hypothetical protein n=1 Tax=Tabrizicola aquatica TaxID=909926 RepID=UPI000CD2C4CD|nr:hypothetical protein [Tabrizicola aquatica]
MTRYSSLLPLLIALPLAGTAASQTLIADAFGLYDPTSAPGRQSWAGWTSAGLVAAAGPDRVLILAGPKSLVAGKDPGHVVALVLDRHGNLVADGTPASVTVDGTPFPTPTRGGIADLLVPPMTRAGEVFAGATAGDRQSPKAMLGVTADLASVAPALEKVQSNVTGETFFEIASAKLTDRFGNPLPEGTAASVILQHEDGSHSVAYGLALQDRIGARFIARDIAGPATAQLALGSRTSDETGLAILAPQPVGRPNLEVTALPLVAAVDVRLGPFLTTDGYTLNDGAPVTLALALGDGTTITEAGWIRDGEVSLTLPIAPGTGVTAVTLTSPLGMLDFLADWQAAAPRSMP